MQSIRNKIVITFLFGCAVAFLSGFIARVVFEETFATIDAISKPNPRLRLMNRIFHQIHRLDQAQKQQLLKSDRENYDTLRQESDRLYALLDSLDTGVNDSLQLARVDRMKNILRERETMFNNYIRFRNSNSLSSDMRRLSEYVENNTKKPDSLVHSRKTTTEVVPVEEKKETPKKESFFRRIFGRKKNTEEVKPVNRKTVTEEVEITLDTLAVSRRDSFIKDMKLAILDIENKQSKKGLDLMDQEMKLNAAISVFMDELQQLLQQVQQDEINTIQDNTHSLSAVFNTAFSRVGMILIFFFLISLVLLLLIFSDISHSNKVRLQLIDAREKAEQLEKAKHRFLANMSHEIRTPLQSIIGYAEQLKLQHPGQAVNAVYSASRHLLQTVNEVLDYSRIVSGRFTFETQDFNPGEVLAEVCDNIQGQADQKQIAFRVHSSIDTEMILSGDSFRLKQILYNLLGNAVKFTNAGEVTLTVNTMLNKNGTIAFQFEIKDTGIGMTDEEQKHIFKSFEQASDTTQRLYGGTGLGLSIAKTLTTMQGGSLEVKSQKNKGSVFTLHLSYLRSLNTDVTSGEIMHPAPISFRGKIVLIDDDHFIVQLCETIFKKHGIDHICFTSSEELSERDWDGSVRAVFMDMRMPVINGYALFGILKKKAAADVRFIALTAHALPEERTKILETGFDDILLKPFTESDLLNTIRRTGEQQNAAGPNLQDNFDLQQIENMCGNDAVMIQTTLSLFAKQSRKDLGKFKEGFDTQQPQLIADSAHRLSAAMGQMGMHLTAHFLREAEQLALENKQQRIDHERLMTSVGTVIHLVDQRLASV